MNTPDIAKPQVCKQHERQEMIALVDSVMRKGSDQTFLTDYPLVYLNSNLENIFIIKIKEEIACVVPYFPRTVLMDGCRFTIGIISPTATSPQHRKRGYARKCLGACVDSMAANGIDLSVLWTEIPTFRFYEHEHFQGVCNQEWRYSCQEEDAYLFSDHGYQIIEYDAQAKEYITDIQHLHEKEIFGILRSAEDYSFLFSLPKSKTLLAMQDKKLVGYLLISHSINKPGLVEAGGEREAIETLVHHLLEEISDSAKLPVYDNLTPTMLGGIFEEKMPSRKFSITDCGMMIRINNFRSFVEKIQPWLEHRNAGRVRNFSLEVTDGADLVSFCFSERGLKLGNDRLQTHLELSRRELTSIVFGPHSERPVGVPDIIKDLFPFYFPIWQLDHS